MMQTMNRKRLIAGLGLLVALGRPASAQEARAVTGPPPTFPARVEQVTVDVVVTDKKGQPVTDLREGDIEVLEDGVRQTIVSLDLFQVPEAPVTAVAAAASPALPRAAPGVDEHGRGGSPRPHLRDRLRRRPPRAATAQQAKAAIAEFLGKETREGDRVTLLATGGRVWWTTRMEAGRAELLFLLKRLDGLVAPETRRDWMSDYEAMQIHVFRDNVIQNRVQRRFETYGLMTMTGQSQHVRNMMAVEDPVITSRAAEVYYAATARNHVTLGAMQRALEALGR